MSVRLVACDLDGTLLNDEKNISERNIKAIHLLEEHNVDFLICSGREINSVRQLKEKYNLNFEAILLNGALYIDKDENAIIAKTIADDAVRQIIRIFDAHGCDFTVQTLHGIRSRHTYEEMIDIYANHMVEIGWARDVKQAYDKMDDVNFFIGNERFDSVEELLPNGVLKIENHQNHNLDITHDINEELKKIPGISIVYYSSGNVEITDISATKGATLKEVSKLKHLCMDEVMPFGDEGNDYSMLSIFPNSIAMCNGSEEVKKVAGRISQFPNTEDGVGVEIERLFK